MVHRAHVLTLVDERDIAPTRAQCSYHVIAGAPSGVTLPGATPVANGE